MEIKKLNMELSVKEIDSAQPAGVLPVVSNLDAARKASKTSTDRLSEALNALLEMYGWWGLIFVVYEGFDGFWFLNGPVVFVGFVYFWFLSGVFLSHFFNRIWSLGIWLLNVAIFWYSFLRIYKQEC